MKVEVVMPKMGESLQEGTIIQWLKKEGDAVERDEMILEISTDKVDTEVPSPVSGILAKILAQAEETVEVGVAIAEIETDSEAVQAGTVAEANPATVSPETAESSNANTGTDSIDLVMPKMGESLQEGTIVTWLKQVGDKIERDEMVLEISTDKVDTEIPSPVEGVLAEILASEGETVEVGTAIARISTSGKVPSVQQHIPVESKDVPKQEAITAPAKTVAATKSGTVTYEIPRKSGDRFYSPLVRKIAEENKVSLEELNSINGSGIETRVVKKDILAYIEQRKSVEVSPAVIAKPSIEEAAAKPVAQPVDIKPMEVPAMIGAGDEIIPMDRMRQLIAEHMVMSKQTSPHVTSVSEADVTGIVKLRNKFRDEFFNREGFKLTYTPFFAKACLDGIAQFPMVNVSVEGNNIIRHRRVNLSFATALPNGNLIVPVIKNADALSITGLARSVYDLSTRARNKKLMPDDIQGGTFTITNVGTFGTLFGTPIINQPQVGIMGIGAIKKRPVVKELDGEHLVVVRDMAYITITYDHRVVDGMLAGQTLAAIVKSLENMNENTLSW